MRSYFLKQHLVYAAPVAENLRIEVMDERGAGGASHHYRVTGFTALPPSREQIPADQEAADVIFQDGSVPEHGINGLTNEALLAIVADRLQGFENGPFPCRENREALRYVEAALMYLHLRTRGRQARGVEGQHVV